MSFTNGYGHGFSEDIIAETVFAKRFVLMDEQNRHRIALYLAEDGSPCFVLYDEQKRIRLELALETDGRPSIVMRNADGDEQVSLTIGRDQYPYLRLSDHKQQLRACLYIAEDTPALNLYDRQEKIRACLTLDPQEGDTPYLLLYNKDEERQIALTVPTDGSEGLLVQDREGENQAVQTMVS